MFTLLDLQRKSDGVRFEEELAIKAELLERDASILDVTDVVARGHVGYEAGLYVLTYDLSYVITLPSSRSMEPVALAQELSVNELFIKASDVALKKDLVDEELVLILEADSIDLKESVVDNILLNIPLRVLSPEELAADSLPTGESWSVLTEEQYQALKAEEKENHNPFQALSSLVLDDE